jgi:tetratricopeptide (TPR) repeat protein
MLSSCSYIQKIAGRESNAIDTEIKRAETHLALGDYKKALEAYAGAYADHPRSTALRARYIKAGEQIKSATDAAFQRKAYAEAGSGYTTLLKSHITDKDFSRELSFDGDTLNRQIKASSKGLLETGLVQYRQGKLDEAISVWRKVIAFDPDNKEAKDAIATAAVQLQNLKNIR